MNRNEAQAGGERPGTIEWLANGLEQGDREVQDWIRERAHKRGAPRFTGWSWRWIEEDFVSDLTLQLTVTLRRPGFRLRGPLTAYVDVAISNLCKNYFRRLAGHRRQDPVETIDQVPRSRSDASLDRVALALDLRRGLLSISPEGRELILGKYVDGLSLKELAARLRIEPKTVNSRLHTYRTQLRRFLSRIGRGGRAIDKTAAGDS
ncbi:MAG: sigma-70 family RNA polymerase sigma factor [bacterium]|nr:sigma-70 family RNA polymerase sigma factor [bacterium]